jgi:hypothetical protein
MTRIACAPLDMHKQFAAAETPHLRAALERQIAATDREI